jgi:hypothetical protein
MAESNYITHPPINLYEEIAKILTDTGAHERLAKLADWWGWDEYEDLGVEFEGAMWEIMQEQIRKG